MRQFIYQTWTVFAVFFAATTLLHAQIAENPVFTKNQDIGDVEKAGDLRYNADKQQFTIKGGGANIWDQEDAFHFAWKTMEGNFILRARVRFKGEGSHAHRKTGWMVRASKAADAAYVDAALHGDGLTALQFRKANGATTNEMVLDVKHPEILQLEKTGNKYVMGAAQKGKPMVFSDTLELDLPEKVLAGIFMSSHQKGVTETALFSNLRVTVPAPMDYTPYEDYSGSRLEIMDVKTHRRKVIYTTEEAIEAPNWSRDGKHLIYNSQGKLYKIPAEGGTPEQINTGFAESLNNDHGISRDGSMIAISHHDESVQDRPGSRIYVLPYEGGTPRAVTDKTPSYWHGWSPDDKFLVYTAMRNGAYNIYKIPTDGGKEIQLTDHPMLDDGSEYSTYGTYIYINSARTHTMQIWRMKPDGDDLEQLTFDRYNDWFPHISPQNDQIAFLSYPPEIDAEAHPHYKHVMLRCIKPSAKGNPRVLTYLYGGQGTINVPSWNPQGTKVAFVSYSFPGGDWYE